MEIEADVKYFSILDKFVGFIKQPKYRHSGEKMDIHYKIAEKSKTL